MSPKHSRWFQPRSGALSVPYSSDDDRRQEAGEDEVLLSKEEAVEECMKLQHCLEDAYGIRVSTQKERTGFVKKSSN